YNGSLPQGDRGRKRSKFVLYKKPEPTGVRRSIHYTVNTPQSSQAILDTSQHSISYTLSRNHAVIVEYTSDDQTDMFQSKQHLEKVVDELNAGRPQCPVGLNTLVIPRRLSPNDSSTTQQPYVYLNCGHVQGLHEWGQERESSNRKCPICLELGPVVKLCMGLEPAFYVDSGIPCFAFNPCGHMASEKTVKYWSGIVIPHGTNGAQAVCPFCVTHLCSYPGIMSTRTTTPEGK
ncbi:hypothetical protein YQE_11826, partial [Dendroctonus ponderosae]